MGRASIKEPAAFIRGFPSKQVPSHTYFSSRSPSYYSVLAPNILTINKKKRMPPITRVVQIQFKDGVDADTRRTVRVVADVPTSIATQREPLTVNICYIKTLEKVRAMKVNCLSRETGQPYIQSIKVGKDVSPEPLNVSPATCLPTYELFHLPSMGDADKCR
jgi:hypothetical protein